MNVNLIYLISGASFVILMAGTLLFFDYLRSLDGPEVVISDRGAGEPIMISLETENPGPLTPKELQHPGFGKMIQSEVRK